MPPTEDDLPPVTRAEVLHGTTAPPGTLRKIAVMQARDLADRPIFHAADATEWTGTETDRLPPTRLTHQRCRGVYYVPPGRWVVKLWDRAAKKHRHLGTFPSRAEAEAVLERAKAQRDAA